MKMDILGKEIVTFDESIKTPWMTFAQSLIGQKEIVGKDSNATIVEMFKYTDLGPQNDDIPWCAAFVNYCLFRTGFHGTKKAYARSFLEPRKGIIRISEFKEGCIVVFPRGDDPAKGHVGFGVSEKRAGPAVVLKILGGNQGNEVNISTYFRNPLGYFWPLPIE